MSNPALGIAETIQTASIKKHPSPAHDINPATAASEKQPAVEATPSEAGSYPSDVVDARHTIRPAPRRAHLPPLPDLRFEQSYLASIKGAETWQRVTWITIRDQVLLPLLQGTLWTLALAGWRHWNRNASLSGATLGSRIRRWWYEVNNWDVPPLRNTRRVSPADVEDYYTAQFSNAGSD